MTTTTSTPTLFRPRGDRIIAGVCSGLARRFGWNVTAVRVIAILSIVLPGSQLLAYAICWLVIPSEPEAPESWLGTGRRRSERTLSRS